MPVDRTRVENELWSSALICAILLLFAPLGGRTVWIHDNGGSIRDAAGWDWLVPLCAVTGIVGLAIGRYWREETRAAALGAAFAAAAFGLAALAAGQYGLALLVAVSWLWPASGK